MCRLFVLVAMMLLPLVGIAGYGVKEYSEERLDSRMYPESWDSNHSTRSYPPESLADNVLRVPVPGLDVSYEWDTLEDFNVSDSNRVLSVSIMDKRVAYNNLMDFSSRGEAYAQLFQTGFWDSTFREHSEDNCDSYPFDHAICDCLSAIMQGYSRRHPDGGIRVMDSYTSDGGLLMTFPQYPDVEPVDVTEFFSGWLLCGVLDYLTKVEFTDFLLRWYFDGESYFPVYTFRIGYSSVGNRFSPEMSYNEWQFYTPPNSPSGFLEAWSQSLGDFFVSLGLPRDVNYLVIPGGDPVGVSLGGGLDTRFYYYK